MDEAECRRVVEDLAERAAEVLAYARRERAARAAADEDTAWLDRFLAEFGPIVDQADALEVFRAISAVVERHGPGPWPAEDFAAIAGRDPAVVRRVLDDMAAEELAERPDRPT